MAEETLLVAGTGGKPMLLEAVRFAILLAALLALPAAGWTQVSVTANGDRYTLENAHCRLQVDAAGGARVCSWILKPSERELIALWKDGQEIGGALDDRAFFTVARYDAAIMNPGPEEGILRLEARHPSGLAVLKTLTLHRDRPALTVSYEFRNGTQTPQQLFIRNFFLPGDKPQTDDHRYWVNADPAAGREPVIDAADAGEYYRPARPEFAALWHRATGDGILVCAPGAAQFYFWRASREFPTFEWLYPDVPPGRILRTSVMLVAVAGQTTTPDWSALATTHAAEVPATSLAPLPGWVDEATRFGITAAERQRGFWLSLGEDEGRRRLPASFPLDLPRNDDRYLPIVLNVLKELRGTVRVQVPSQWQRQVQAQWQTTSNDRVELRELPSSPLTLKAGTRETLWLRVGTHGKQPGQYRIPLRLSLGSAEVPITLALRVWPVTLTGKRPFHVRGYYSGPASLAGGATVTDATTRRLDAVLKVYAAMGGDVLDWLWNWLEVLPHVKIAATGESLMEVARTAPERLDLANLPRLDFSYYDPWLAVAKRHGVTHVETYLDPLDSDRYQWILLDPAVGKERVKAGTPEATRVITWFFREWRRYFAAKGFTGFFCKISDEISPEHIPAYLAAARVARAAGWRPFTTVTGMVARTAQDIEAMNPLCDQWQLGFGSKDEFLGLLRKRFRVVQETHPLAGEWGHYTNGGAQETWALRAFGREGVTRVDPHSIERLEVLEDGRPLALSGGSPWGNTTRGTAFTSGSLGDWLYLSPTDGANPATHRYEVRLTLRRESPQGKPLVTLEPTDQLWCYGGGSSPYRGSYANAWAYPAMTLFHRFHGYGQWAFYWWQPSERIIWIDEQTNAITVSPPYCGYRDGWRDALLMHQWIARAGRKAYDRVVAASPKAILRVEPRSAEVYHFTTIGNAGDFLALNAARRAALAGLAAAPKATPTARRQP